MSNPVKEMKSVDYWAQRASEGHYYGDPESFARDVQQDALSTSQSKIDELEVQLGAYKAVIDLGFGAMKGFVLPNENFNLAVERLVSTQQRYHDLVRYQRAELHQAELITDDEYTELLSDPKSVKRLESYDAVKAKLKELEQDKERLDWLETMKYIKCENEDVIYMWCSLISKRQAIDNARKAE